MSRELYRTNIPPIVGTTVEVNGSPYLITRTKSYRTEPWSTIVVYGKPTTLQGEMRDLHEAWLDFAYAVLKASVSWRLPAAGA